MTGKRLKRDTIKFMNGKHDDFWGNIHFGSIMLACIGVSAAAFSEAARMCQVDSYVGRDQNGKDRINDLSKEFDTRVK